MTAAVADFLAAHIARPWQWGSVDCSLILADWAVANGWPDPAVAVRGVYGTQLECARLVRRAGGLLSLVGRLLDTGGLPRTDRQDEGTIAVIGTSGWRQWGAIFEGRRWVVREKHRLVRVRAVPLAMWAV